jgi:hypothetical protein
MARNRILTRSRPMQLICPSTGKSASNFGRVEDDGAFSAGEKHLRCKTNFACRFKVIGRVKPRRENINLPFFRKT